MFAAVASRISRTLSNYFTTTKVSRLSKNIPKSEQEKIDEMIYSQLQVTKDHTEIAKLVRPPNDVIFDSLNEYVLPVNDDLIISMVENILQDKDTDASISTILQILTEHECSFQSKRCADFGFKAGAEKAAIKILSENQSKSSVLTSLKVLKILGHHVSILCDTLIRSGDIKHIWYHSVDISVFTERTKDSICDRPAKKRKFISVGDEGIKVSQSNRSNILEKRNDDTSPSNGDKDAILAAEEGAAAVEKDESKHSKRNKATLAAEENGAIEQTNFRFIPTSDIKGQDTAAAHRGMVILQREIATTARDVLKILFRKTTTYTVSVVDEILHGEMMSPDISVATV